MKDIVTGPELNRKNQADGLPTSLYGYTLG